MKSFRELLQEEGFREASAAFQTEVPCQFYRMNSTYLLGK